MIQARLSSLPLSAAAGPSPTPPPVACTESNLASTGGGTTFNFTNPPLIGSPT